MLPNGIDSLLLQVTNLSRVYKSAILPSALSTFACEVDTHQLGHTFGEDSAAIMAGLLRKNIPISLLLRLVGSAVTEQEGFFKGVTAESRLAASLQKKIWVLMVPEAPSASVLSALTL